MPKVKVSGLNIHYEEAGQGDVTLVCLHGISSNSRSWRYQLAELSDRYRIIAWDMRGYGQSDDPTEPYSMADLAYDLAGLLDNLGLEQAVIVGLSMGGVVAQEFYRCYPERVKALVLADTNTGGGARPEDERKARLEARLKAVETMTPAEMAKSRAPALLSPHASPELLQEVESMISELHPIGYKYAAIALDGADTRDILPNINVPTLLLRGSYDIVVTQIEMAVIQTMIHFSIFKILSAGHLSNLEAPEEFSETIQEFLERVSRE